MAITQYTEPATTDPSLTDWQNSIARDNASSRGFAEVDLSSYADGATAPTVAVGSRFDNNGALYVVSGTAESISGIAGIANRTTFYVYFDVSGGVFLASTTAPTFDKEKRGWYNGNDRALFRIFKDSGGEYDDRGRILQENGILNISELTVSKNVTINGALAVTPFVYQSSSAVTDGTLYTTLSPLVPSIGDERISSGGGLRTSSSDHFVFSSIQRAGATSVNIRGYDFSTSASLQITVGSGGVTNTFNSLRITVLGIE
jgi:hypothetical protein